MRVCRFTFRLRGGVGWGSQSDWVRGGSGVLDDTH